MKVTIKYISITILLLFGLANSLPPENDRSIPKEGTTNNIANISFTLRESVNYNLVDIDEYVVKLSANAFTTCAILNTGKVKCWGQGFGNSPVELDLITDHVIDMGIGGDGFQPNHYCILTSEGAVKCWGSNEHGELGDGTNIEKNIPVNVIGLSTGVQAIYTGYHYTCAVTQNGGVKCWG